MSRGAQKVDRKLSVKNLSQHLCVWREQLSGPYMSHYPMELEGALLQVISRHVQRDYEDVDLWRGQSNRDEN